MTEEQAERAIIESAFDMRYASYCKQFCEINGGMESLRNKLFEAVDAWDLVCSKNQGEADQL